MFFTNINSKFTERSDIFIVSTCKFMNPEVLPVNKNYDLDHCFSIRPFIKTAQKITVYIIGSEKDQILFFILLIIINHRFK